MRITSCFTWFQTLLHIIYMIYYINHYMPFTQLMPLHGPSQRPLLVRSSPPPSPLRAHAPRELQAWLAQRVTFHSVPAYREASPADPSSNLKRLPVNRHARTVTGAWTRECTALGVFNTTTKLIAPAARCGWQLRRAAKVEALGGCGGELLPIQLPAQCRVPRTPRRCSRCSGTTLPSMSRSRSCDGQGRLGGLVAGPPSAIASACSLSHNISVFLTNLELPPRSPHSDSEPETGRKDATIPWAYILLDMALSVYPPWHWANWLCSSVYHKKTRPSIKIHATAKKLAWHVIIM